MPSDRPFGHLIALAGFSACAMMACGPPRLTEERVVEDLGSDRMPFVFFVVRPECIATTRPLCAAGRSRAVEEAGEAASNAGWTQSICAETSWFAILTPQGQEVTSRSWTPHEAGRPCDEMQRFDLVVATYARTGLPVVAAGSDATTKVVTIPGHWVPNADGERLRETGYAPISVVDRHEIFTYFEGKWARHHVGD